MTAWGMGCEVGGRWGPLAQWGGQGGQGTQYRGLRSPPGSRSPWPGPGPPALWP